MPDITITVTDEEMIVLGHFYKDPSAAVREFARNASIEKAQQLIFQSSSTLDPRKINTGALRAEINRLNETNEIKVWKAKQPAE